MLLTNCAVVFAGQQKDNGQLTTASRHIGQSGHRTLETGHGTLRRTQRGDKADVMIVKY